MSKTLSEYESVVKLTTDQQSRERMELLADLYGVVVTADKLDLAFLREHVKPDEYELAFNGLLSKYRGLMIHLKDTVGSIDAFVKKYEIHAPGGVHRLKAGISAIQEYNRGPVETNSYQITFQIGSDFVTLIDAVQVGGAFTAADQLHPLLTTLLECLDRLPDRLRLPEDQIRRVSKWMVKLNEMTAASVLTEDEVRQMTFDLQTAYNAFKNLLQV